MEVKLNKYISKLNMIKTRDNYDVKLVTAIVNRLSSINKYDELEHYVKTLKCFRQTAYTASDYKFYDRVITKLKKILKQHKGD